MEKRSVFAIFDMMVNTQYMRIGVFVELIFQQTRMFNIKLLKLTIFIPQQPYVIQFKTVSDHL